VRVRVEGGMLDGRELDQATPEPTIHQTGMLLLRVHQPYPKRKGEKVLERLLVYSEDYALHQTEDGPVYRCVAPFGGVSVAGETVGPSEGGGYDIYADRDGRLSARPMNGATSAKGDQS
jgi:hypothetical protein